MKQLLFVFAVFALLAAAAIPSHSQPVPQADAVALLAQLATPPKTLADAYQRTYLQGSNQPNAQAYYQNWFDQVDKALLESQTAMLDFYKKNPTGVPKVPTHPANRVSAKDQSAMDAAVAELSQKMLSDPAFAKKFQQMSEAEQHDYIAKSLADKGLKPATGTPNVPNTAMPGTDFDWVTPCNTLMTGAMDMNRWEAQTALQQRYEAQHEAVRAWEESEIKKLPMISMGEYGHDHDPAQVKAIQKQGLDKHRAIANAMMQEASGLFLQLRQQAKERFQPLNDALKNVNYGQYYDFGLNYTLVLQAQSMLLADLQNIARNEISIIEQIARWEYEAQHDTP